MIRESAFMLRYTYIACRIYGSQKQAASTVVYTIYRLVFITDVECLLRGAYSVLI
jgi:hypothetical protein